MKDFFKIRASLVEEHGAGEQGTPSLVAKYKNATPGQGGSGPTKQQPPRKGDKLNAKFEPCGSEDTMKEAINNDHPIAKEYSSLMKKPIGDLHDMIKQQHRIVDVSGYRTKERAATAILRSKHGNKRFADAMGLDEDTSNVTEAIKLGSKVKMHAPGKDYHGQIGRVGEIRHGAYKGAPKTYTVDYGDRSSIQLDKKNVKLHKEEAESVEEASNDYFKRRKREKDVDAGRPVKKLPKNPQNDYFARRKKMGEEATEVACQVCRQAPCKCTKVAADKLRAKKYNISPSEYDDPISRSRKKVTEGENKQIKGGDPCWKDYEMIGMKPGKDGRKVPNCVPVNKESITPGRKHGNPCWKGYRLAGMKPGKNGRSVPNCVPAVGSPIVKENLKASIKEFRDMIEEASYKVDVEGLPTMYVTSTSPADVKTNLRKILKKADMIRSVDRISDAEVKKSFRLKAIGKDEEEQ